jgi:hypothetical protein
MTPTDNFPGLCFLASHFFKRNIKAVASIAGAAAFFMPWGHEKY